MESPSVYIPIDRRHALASGRELPDRAQGAALFADISGFTPLTEALTRTLGPERGAEELVSYLDRVYDALIAEVERFGGSVVSFSGDAVTCWFDGDDARRATASAFAIQETMRQFARLVVPHNSAVSLTVKVAVTSGAVRRFVVGDPSIQLIDVLAGTTLDRLASAEEAAESGEVVLDGQTFQSLSPSVELREWRVRDSIRYAVSRALKEAVQPQPWPPVSPAALQDEQIRPWLLAPVYERLKTGQGKFLAELRHAVALFLNFRGIDYDGDAAAGAKLDAFIRWVQQITARYEGALVELVMGDKGSYLGAAFGAPVAHDDDAARAVAAALDLRAPPQELDFIQDIKIGISSGSMRTGAYGSANRLTYGIHGDEVNFAARLMQHAASGQIIVGERVALAAASRYSFRPLGASRFKGKQDAVNVFELLAKEEPRPAATRHAATTLVGRTRERELILEKLEALRAEKTSAVLIVEGEAGIGKSRLIEFGLNEAQAAGMNTFTGAGDAIEKSTPYRAWRPVFGHLFGLDAVQPDKEARRAHVLSQLQASVAPELIRFAPLLNAVLPLDFPENELTAQMSGQVRADNTLLLLSQVLQQLASSGPLVLALEDAHWFDSASWALARHIAREVHPLLQMIATRPPGEPLPAEYRSLLEDPRTLRVQLEPLPEEDIQALIAQRLGVKTLPDEVITLIRDKAEGHPFFSEELAYALRDAGLILIRGEVCEIAPNVDLKTAGIPDTVQEVVTSRIDRLGPTQQLTIKVASVIGRIFAYRILYDTFPVDAERPLLQEQLKDLERLDLTRLDTPEPDLSYIFKHIITQEVSYSLLLFAQRRDLHQRVAEWYERHFAGDLSPFYSLLAYHWGKAEIPAKTVAYLEQAGAQALRNYANAEAVAFFEQALQLTDGAALEVEASRRARWELQAGEAHANLSDYREARQHIERGFALLGNPVPGGKLGQAARLLGEILSQVEHHLLPAQSVALSSSQRAQMSMAAAALEKFSEATYFTGQPILAMYSAFRNLNMTEAGGPSPELGRAAAAVGSQVGFIPLRRAAEGYLDRALKIVQASDHLESREFVLMASSYYYSGLGAWAQVIEQAGQLIQTAQRLGDVRRWQDGMGILMSAHYFQGDFATSAQLADELYASASRHRDLRYIARAVQGKAYSNLHLGKLEEAWSCSELLQTLIGGGAKVPVLQLAMELWGLLAVTHLRRSEYEQAAKAAEQALALTTKSRASFYAAFFGYAAPADVYLTLWETNGPSPDAKSSAVRACQALKKYARIFQIGQPRLSLSVGRYAWLKGRHTEARRAMLTSLARAEQLGMVYDQGLAHYEIARHLPASDSARSEHLTQAVNLFSQVGAAYDLERARRI